MADEDTAGQAAQETAVQEGGSFFDDFMQSGDQGGNGGLDFSQAEKVLTTSQGQGSDSPTDTGDGQTSGTQSESGETETVSETTDTSDGKPKGGESTSEETTPADTKTKGEEGKDGEKPLPYDNDPKWKAARAAQKTLDEILERNGLESTEDLQDAIEQLKEGESIKDLLGDADVKELLKADKELKDIKAYWAEQDETRRRDEEDPQDTIKRLEGRVKSLQDNISTKEADRQAYEESQKALNNFNSTVESLVDGVEGLDDTERGLLGVMMGLDNPMDTIDISDTRAVKATAAKGIKAFKDFLANYKQKTIDEYAKGQSDITAIPKGDGTPGVKSAKKKQLPKNASEEQVFSSAKDEMYENFMAMLKEEA